MEIKGWQKSRQTRLQKRIQKSPINNNISCDTSPILSHIIAYILAKSQLKVVIICWKIILRQPHVMLFIPLTLYKITVVAKCFQDRILKKFKEGSKVFSIIADEARNCSNQEQMPLIIRYVDSHKHIVESCVFHSVNMVLVCCKYNPILTD